MRTQRSHEDGGYDGRWLGILVFAVGLLATLMAWRTIRIHEHSEVRWVTKLTAQAIRTDIVTDMEWQLVGLDRLALLWETADPPQELWTKNADLYLEHRPGSVAVAWLTPEAERRALITRKQNPNAIALAFDGVPKDLLSAVSRSQVAMISAPVVVSSGGRQWAIAHPVYVSGQLRGFIVSFFDLKESLDYILGDVTGLGFSFAVVPPNQPEYLFPGSSREHEQEWGELVDVPLSGVTWQVRVWPRTDVVTIIKSSLPDVALAAGSVVSFLLALTLYLALGAAHSSARTQHANEALQREISVREGAEEALRRAHAELETRIDRRTAELAAANALLQKEVAEHQRTAELLQALTGRLFHLQDEERRRLARELHDGAVQSLVALAMNVGMIGDAVPTADVRTKELVTECGALIEQSTKELRTISYLLHPPYFDELGLQPVLRDFVQGFAARSDIKVTLDIDPKLGRLGHELELAIYRVVQEALSNVHRHAQCRTANVTLGCKAGFVQLEIADAGRGIPPGVLSPDRPGFAGVGIAGMRERVRLLGGRLEVQSGAGGTSVQAILPLPDSGVSLTADSTDPPKAAGLRTET